MRGSKKKAMSERIRHAQKIVIKIGTSILKTRGESFSHKEHARVCQEIHALIRKGRRPVLVSSGAIALGIDALAKDAVGEQNVRAPAQAGAQGRKRGA